MWSPFTSERWLILEEVSSTQDELIRFVHEDLRHAPDIVFTWWQKKGRGRFDRTWFNEPRSAVAMSMVFKQDQNHPKPWLIGMSVATAAASILHCKLQWPNDLVLHGKKLGGVLTQMVGTGNGVLVPIVGIGINICRTSFPEEIKDRAISLEECRPGPFELEKIARDVIRKIKELPQPDSWSTIQPLWKLFDATKGKKYQLSDGKVVKAIAIGSEGELIGSVDGEIRSVIVAEALGF